MAKDNAKRKRPAKSSIHQTIACFNVWLRDLRVQVGEHQAKQKIELLVGK